MASCHGCKSLKKTNWLIETPENVVVGKSKAPSITFQWMLTRRSLSAGKPREWLNNTGSLNRVLLRVWAFPRHLACTPSSWSWHWGVKKRWSIRAGPLRPATLQLDNLWGHHRWFNNSCGPSLCRGWVTRTRLLLREERKGQRERERHS